MWRVELHRTRTAFDERGQPFTLYALRSDRGSTSWVSERRFSEFKKLASALSDRYRQGGGSAGRPPPDLPKGVRLTYSVSSTFVAVVLSTAPPTGMEAW